MAQDMGGHPISNATFPPELQTPLRAVKNKTLDGVYDSVSNNSPGQGKVNLSAVAGGRSLTESVYSVAVSAATCPAAANAAVGNT